MTNIVPSADPIGDLNDYRYFAVVAQSGGFSAASRLLGLPKSRLSRRVSGLEARLGVRLLQRSTRRLALTEVGRQVLTHCEALLREAEIAACVATSRQAEPSGLLRVSTPATLLDDEIEGVFEAFLAAYPKVSLELVVTSRRVDLIEEGVDLALRVRSPDDEDPQWATRRLRPAQGVLVASPDCITQHGGLTTLAQLREAPALGAAAADRKVHWRLRAPDASLHDVAAPARLSCEHFGLRRSAAEAGVGVTMLPQYMARAALDAGRLQRVLPDWAPPPSHLQAVYPTQRGISPALRALIDRLAAALALPA
jgi:DNA-binding transcriptional LysR family regulator